MDRYCEWLPEKICFDDFCDWDSYEKELYRIFVHDFVNSHPLFKGKSVGIRHYPEHNGKEEGFYHLTHEDYYKKGYDERVPDLRRCERIPWIRKVIENYGCNKNCCSHLKIWRNKKRVHILFEEYQYLLVLEDRKNYYVVVTAFYIEYKHNLMHKLKEYDKLKNNPI